MRFIQKKKRLFKQKAAFALGMVVVFGGFLQSSSADEKFMDVLVLKGQAELEIRPTDTYPSYEVRVEVGTDKEGTILYVKDDGTQPHEGSKRFWRRFTENTEHQKGFAGFIGKNKGSLEEMDAVTGATQSSDAVKEAVRQALGTIPPVVLPGDSQEKKIVTAQEVNKILPPKTDEHPIRSIYGNGQYRGKILWEPYIEPGGHFAEKTSYIAKISLTPEEGWTFEGLPEDFFRVQGMESASFKASTGILTVAFPKTGPDPKIENFEEPKLSELLLKRDLGVKKDPGVYTGKGKAIDREARKEGRKGEVVINDSISVEIEAKVSVDDQGKVSEVEVKSVRANPNFRMKPQTRNFNKYKSYRFYIGKTYEEILQMDVRYRVSPFVPLLESDKEEDKMHLYAQALHRAILNALGHEEKEETPAGPGTVFSGGASIERFNYVFQAEIEVDGQGRILNAWDEINDKETAFDKGGLGNLDNGKAVRHFRDELGYDRFIGKTADEVATLDMGMYGLDVVTGATYTSKGAKNAVLEALKKAGHEPSGAKPSEPEFVAWYDFKLDASKIKYTNRAETHYGEATAVVFLDRDKKISKIKVVSNTIPTQVVTPGLAKDWRRFIQIKGFHRYYFMNLNQVKNAPADNPKIGDLFTDFKAKEVAELVKSELVKVMEKHEEKAHHLTVNGEEVGYFVLGNQIVLDAPPANPEGVPFKEWRLVSGGGEFDDEGRINARFEMSDDEAVIEAVYESPKKEIRDQEVMTIEENENYRIEDGNTIEIRTGGTLDVNGRLIVGIGSSLILEEGSVVRGRGRIKREELKQEDIADIPDQTHTGNAILPRLQDQKTRLLLDTEDYELQYEGNVEVGTAVLRLTPKNLSGKAMEKTFRIVAAKNPTPPASPQPPMPPSAPPQPSPPQSDPPRAIYQIEISPSEDKDFGVLEEGYPSSEEYLVQIRNTGNRLIRSLSISLSGKNAEAFLLGTQKIAGLPIGESSLISVRPKDGLAQGSYEALLRIEGEKITESVALSFKVGDEDGYLEWLPRRTVSADKQWEIRFNEEVDSESLTEESIRVQSAEDKQLVEVRLELSEDKKTVRVIALTPYLDGKSYVLYVRDLRSVQGGKLKEKVKMYFDIASSPLLSLSPFEGGGSVEESLMLEQ